MSQINLKKMFGYKKSLQGFSAVKLFTAVINFRNVVSLSVYGSKISFATSQTSID